METIKIFRYKSIGRKHENEVDFFKFVIQSKFNDESNRSLQWCKFEGMNIICKSLEPSIIDFVELILVDIIETSTGYKWKLTP
jgi:hypothetical protein